MSTVIPVTRTKLRVPRRRAEILSRPRLLELLDELLDYRLVIVAAPAGYGKTSLLVDYAEKHLYPFCWYALDAHDKDDPRRFFAHFISAISENEKFRNFGKSSLAALESMSQDNLNLDALISLVINDIYENITEHFVLVLDDYHLVEEQKDIRYFINRFIQDVGENCHLILASRILLDLPDMTLMVARSQVGGLSYEELTFLPDEIQKLMQKNYDIALSDAEAAELANETEGWVTGLLLSTQVQGKMFANRLRVARVSGVGLYEYMAQQILEQQPEDFQKFLLRTSLLEEFDENLCAEVIGRALGIDEDWRKMMREVPKRILFVIPVGEEGSYLRYHHLFQEFLRTSMRRDHPVEARAILLQLAVIYSRRQEWERSYRIYLDLGEKEALVGLVEGAGASMINKGQVLTLSEWLVKLPPDLLYRNPTLISLHGAVTVYRGDTGQGLKLLDQAVDGLRRVGDPAPLAHTLYRRSTAYRIVGQYRDALHDADEALQLLLPQSRSNVVYADALMSKGSVLYSLGKLNEALVLLQESLEAYLAMGDEGTAAKVYIEIGRVAKTLGKYMDAEDAYTRALNHYQATGNLNWQANLYNNLGVLQHDRSDYAAATSSFEKAIQYARIAGSQRVEAYTLASIGDLYQELGAVRETREAYRQAKDISLRIHEEYLLFYLSLMEARIRLSQEDWQGAQEIIEQVQAQAEIRANESEKFMCLMERGRLSLAQEKVEQALVDFSAALSFFVNQRYENQIPRAQLYAMVAAMLAGHAEVARQHAEMLKPMLGQAEKLKILVAAGREARAYLEDLREEPELFGLTHALLSHVEQHTQGIPALRRLIRRHAVVVPFAPPKMTIRALGRAQVKVSDHILTGSEWQVQTARDLFFLLLANPKGQTKEQIGEIFWPGSSPSELKLRFKNTIYRLRHAAGKDSIVFLGDDTYMFNRDMDYEYDVETFLKEISLAENAADAEKKRQHYRNAINHYGGKYLPDVDLEWVFLERDRLDKYYVDALLRLANLALDAQEFELVLDFCGRLLTEDRCNEEAHRLIMKVHAARGNLQLVIRQYEQCSAVLDEDLGVIPSIQTRILYESLIK